MGESGDSDLFSFTDAVDSGDEGLCSTVLGVESVRTNSISDVTDSGDDRSSFIDAVAKNDREYCGVGESGDNDLNSFTDDTD